MESPGPSEPRWLDGFEAEEREFTLGLNKLVPPTRNGLVLARRCDRTMFDVSNIIAYGGDLMVYGTTHEGDFPGENCWIDVRSGQSEGNWVPAEGAALAHLLHELTEEHGVAQQDIRVISPFRDVVRGARMIGRQRVGWSFAETNVGTVHTVQGKAPALRHRQSTELAGPPLLRRTCRGPSESIAATGHFFRSHSPVMVRRADYPINGAELATAP
jgi:hypothetical protein